MVLAPIPNPALGANNAENHIHNVEDVFGKCFQNTELREKMKMLRGTVAIQDTELKSVVRILISLGWKTKAKTEL